MKNYETPIMDVVIFETEELMSSSIPVTGETTWPASEPASETLI